MNIGLLNQTVTFQKQETVADKVGNHINEWTDYYTCHATVSGEGGDEVESSGGEVDHTTMNVTIRWCRKASAITETNFRVIFRDEIYDITSVDHMSFKGHALKCKCRKVRR